MNKKIYTFWLGDEDCKKRIQNKIQIINEVIKPWEIILGPTEEEHNFFYKNSKFYKRSYDKKIYSFCSDVYRSYIVWKNGGAWIDSGFEYNLDKIQIFLKQLDYYDNMFVFENQKYFLSGCFYFKEANSKILRKCYEDLNKFSRRKDLYQVPTMPIIFSRNIFKFFGTNLNKKKNKKILLLKSRDMKWDSDFSITMHPTGSWNKNSGETGHIEKVKKLWEECFNDFDKKYSNIDIRIKRFVNTNYLFRRIAKIKFIKKIYFSFFHKKGE